MEIVVTGGQPGEPTLVALRGDLDASTAPSLRAAFADVFEEGAVAVVVDLGGVTFVDSTGLGVLVQALRRARSVDARLVLCGATRQILPLLRLTGLDKVFDRYDDTAAALGAVRA